ncbi:uncharacterized protein LOC122642766 [Telopea speciosissima]|uniref:uncharacterized protein LOC122642766 n=1 Tax=Telopea speciosissima TaxID=54955 RepID=UPI001CC50BBD|nr:uncharacterized protein LOC122642766 [Telopea speciosissima]
MEYDAVEHMQDGNEDSMTNGVAKSDNREMNVKDVPVKDSDTTEDTIEINRAGSNLGDDVEQVAASADMETPGEVNMEAFVTADDIIKAGGFGARDDISSLLPVAIDSTDFEASLRDARDYEEPQGEISRPGLGWTDAKVSDE